MFTDPAKVKIIRNYITKFADFRWKYADVSRIQGTCHVIHIFLGSSWGQV